MRTIWTAMAGAALFVAAAASAQVRSVDPNTALAAPQTTPPPVPVAPPAEPVPADERPAADTTPPPQVPSAPPPGESAADATTRSADTYSRDDLLGAAEGVFGRGAQGLAGIIERTLREQGRPNAYIAGREASGAFVVGLRYGSGVLSHRVEGQQPVYWTGPSVGFDVGGDAAKVFVLVYNLYDTEDLYHRFPGGEGRLYFVGGFAATYLRRGNVVLIPVRLGVGVRAGVNVGYMKFTHRSKLLPF
ncbi:DUF1134 domain-containing protein [Sphingomonas sp.]|uniref:DUF1134 domain-containing protein n=1 Tax=Sphingomonas sp. TaxID=28214 RepID=UPI003CC51E35